jgi:hypothetical protein
VRFLPRTAGAMRRGRVQYRTDLLAKFGPLGFRSILTDDIAFR